MKCPKCQKENSDTAKFCKKCGAPLEKNVLSHEKVINSVSSKKSDDKTTKIIIIALAVIAIVLAGAFVYIYGFGGFSGSNDNGANASSGAINDDSSQSTTATPSSTPSSNTPSSLSILGGSFYTGTAESDKTYATIYVGSQHAGQNVVVQIIYSRDGSNLNQGNMVPVTVHSDGYIEVSSADAYHYYPDHATIKIYDTNGHLLDSQGVTLAPTSGTQTF